VQPSESDAVRAVRRLWVSFEARAWEAAGAVLADTFVCEWPQTGERFRGRDNYLAMNRAHPAPNWHIAITRLVGDPTTAAAEVVVTSDNAVVADVVRDGARACGAAALTRLLGRV